ncbi:MAG: T9SS type A sorting domain-containing protein [Saprospiraceae bacterium]|nr:T9SS type A sorting domain-containing protein [Saprospiraceae bacterium]
MKYLFGILFLLSVALVHGQARLEFDFNEAPGGYDTYEMASIDGRIYFMTQVGSKSFRAVMYDPATNQHQVLNAETPFCAEGGSYQFQGYKGDVFYIFDGLYRYHPPTGEVIKVLDNWMTEFFIYQDRLICTYSDGSVGLLDLTTNQWDTLDFSSIGVPNNQLFAYGYQGLKNSFFFLAGKNNQYYVVRYNLDNKMVTRIPRPASQGSSQAYQNILQVCDGQLFAAFGYYLASNYSISVYNEQNNLFEAVSGVKATRMACVQEKLYACDFSANGPMLSVKRDSAGQLIPKTHRLYPGGIGAVNNLFKVDTTLYVLNHRDHKGLYRFHDAIETFQRIDPVSENIIESQTHHGISGIASTLYFIGSAADRSRQLMRYSITDTAVSEALYLLKPNLGTFIRNFTKLGGKGYFLGITELYNQSYTNGTGLLVEFDTTATSQHRILNSQLGIDTILPSTYLTSIDSDLFLTHVGVQGQRYALARYIPNIGLKTYLPGNATILPFLVKYQDAVYMMSGTNLYRYLPATDTVELAMAFANPNVDWIGADANYLYYFMDEKLMRFNGLNHVLVSDSIDRIYPGLNVSLLSPFIFNGKLYCGVRTTSLPGALEIDLTTGAKHIMSLDSNGIGSVPMIGVHEGKIYIGTNFNRGLKEYDPATKLLRNISPTNSIRTAGYFSFGTKFIAEVFDSLSGWEMHEIDLATGNHQLLVDVFQGYCSSYISNPLVFNDKFYFSADDGLHGHELWSYRSCFQANITAQTTTLGQNTGSASVTTIGGSAPFTYQWSNGASTANIDSLAHGFYLVTITDAAGCQSSLNVYIDQLVSFVLQAETMQLRVYPNPFGQRLTLEAIHIEKENNFSVQLIDLQGRMITTRNWNSASPLVLDGLDLPSGVYFLRLQQMSNGASRTVKVVCD